ncbi:hypothetical protein [Mesorhizobium sp. NZP2298]|uniref:hypothetical protein n=1 Tax=Mesorhizobium sp. NZP2298 TaxID=2483403 RepID=UPI001556E73D|nr:hypothetical protein [Mesorhizobium sp. NZP2298]QKC99147.1 hypothetical protein EB231_34715 [Mesorhizobium sp. NZP2298]
MTLESLARTIAKARHGTDEFWIQFMPAAEAAVRALADAAEKEMSSAYVWLDEILETAAP